MSRERGPQAYYPRAVFTDTSGLYALIDEQDQHHPRAREVFNTLTQARSQIVLTNFIRAEIHALILNRLGHHLADRFLEQLRQSPATTLIRVSEQDEEQALTLIARYRDKDFSITDATSFVVMERLGITHAVSFDRDFRQYGVIVLG
jgi:predicted nucleic acid-binding protein